MRNGGVGLARGIERIQADFFVTLLAKQMLGNLFVIVCVRKRFCFCNLRAVRTSRSLGSVYGLRLGYRVALTWNLIPPVSREFVEITTR